MDFKFSKDSDGAQSEDNAGDKKKQSALLILLLILVGGFSYLYFFTGLIKPMETKKVTEAPATPPQAVKMPLPSRDGEAGKTEEKTAAKAEVPKPAATAPAVATPAAKPAQPATKPAAPTVKTAVPVKVKEEVKKTEAAKPAEKKIEKNAAEAKKVPVDKKAAAKKPAASDSKAKAEAVVTTNKATAESWTLSVGNYVLEEALSADIGRVRKAGLEPVVKASARKKSTMNRLFVSDFNDRASAQATLEKLNKHTSDGFVIEQGGKFSLFAGSYLQSEAANSEKDRLKAAGFSVTIKNSDIAIPAQSLSVGPFKTKKAADAALAKLKSVGLKATFSQK